MQNKYIKIKSNLTKIFGSKAKGGSGFTLIETLVAITVLLLAITGPLEIASKSLFSAFYARDQITAYYLAQEGIEYIKNARDNTFLHDVFDEVGNNNWLNGLNNCINFAAPASFGGCYISADTLFVPSTDTNDDSINIAAPSCENNLCPKMSFSETTGLWTQSYDDTQNTKFRRKIEIIPQGNTTPMSGSAGIEEAIIKVTVEWPTANIFGGTKTFELYGSMMNWERK